MTKESSLLHVDNLHVTVDDKPILNGLTLTVEAGTVHAIMGPNGSGKSTLSFVIMGHPKYTVTQGRILYKGEDLLALAPEERAQRGIFLAFQYPTAIPGVTIANFLRAALRGVRGKDVPVKEFRETVKTHLKALGIPESFMNRYVNDGFSGGEKKRLEILQMAVLGPSLAVLDETDSGLDIDALKTVAAGISALRNPQRGMLLITHYQRLLNYIKPDVVHVLVGGRIAKTGGPDLALELESKGYQGFKPATEPGDPAELGGRGSPIAAGGGTVRK
ncbi:MAG: Fe-S cluster assembly ATPase SufC [Candidatus Omnitrophica bacterium CG11_big_fil_rev_8_21_14_0_20_63_9]|nr:MAG: Fe-S cluster assembly ATPase SufC [Candidatus Omnitrophica bacterium CG11_big_fil_rev_8_21_14_0_20_63_9]